MQREISDEIERIYGLVEEQPALQRIVREVNCLISTKDTTEPEKVIGMLFDELEEIQADYFSSDSKQDACRWPSDKLTEAQKTAIKSEGMMAVIR